MNSIKSLVHRFSREKVLLYSIKRLLNNYFEAILCKTNGRLYAFLFNLRSLFLKKDPKIITSKYGYKVFDRENPNIKIEFFHELVGSQTYKFGLKNRAFSLANEYLIDQLDFKDGDVVLDCGANIGDFKLWFEYNKIKINYFGFEPSPKEYSLLVKNVYPSKCFNIGLLDKEEYLDFYLSSQEADSSFFSPKFYDEIIKVKVKRLEGFIEKPIKLLKLEAEGAEPEVLQGIGLKLDMINYISADLGFERGSTQESTLAPVTNYLLKRGFELKAINHDRVIALFKNTKF